MPPRTRPTEPVYCACTTRRHRHGTNRMYVTHRCGCPPCLDAHRTYNARHRQGNTSHRVPADPARELIAAYLAQGHTMAQIADVTTLHERNLWDIHAGKRPTVVSDSIDLLRGARKHLPAPTGRIDATGTRRRLQALAVIGWTTARVAEVAGIDRNVAQYLRSGKHAGCTVETSRRVAAAYDDLWDRTPPAGTPSEKRDATWVTRTAEKHGWLPPAAWDDDRIDDPAYTPNVTRLKRDLQTVSVEKLDDLEHLIGLGVAVEEAALRVGYTSLKTAAGSAQHAGRTRLYQQLSGSEAA
ncbi:hypothetical protein ACFYE2_00565 [Kocuria sp. CPCC 205300]|uniref:hypothetical protein n=1 Tax=Kocuria sabuli TaxID=3071448 RepID=UPI0036DD9D0D